MLLELSAVCLHFVFLKITYSFNDDDMTNAENPLKPFDTLPKSATDLNSLDCDYNDNDDSFKVVFEGMMINLTENIYIFLKKSRVNKLNQLHE